VNISSFIFAEEIETFVAPPARHNDIVKIKCVSFSDGIEACLLFATPARRFRVHNDIVKFKYVLFSEGSSVYLYRLRRGDFKYTTIL